MKPSVAIRINYMRGTPNHEKRANYAARRSLIKRACEAKADAQCMASMYQSTTSAWSWRARGDKEPQQLLLVGAGEYSQRSTNGKHRRAWLTE